MMDNEIEEEDFVYSEMLQCFIVSLEYDFSIKKATVYLGPMSVTDMTGCIKFFKRIDENVLVINCYASDLDFGSRYKDTAYIKHSNRWAAFSIGNGKIERRGEWIDDCFFTVKSP